jgi:hypothetical protein
VRSPAQALEGRENEHDQGKEEDEVDEATGDLDDQPGHSPKDDEDDDQAEKKLRHG